MLEDVAGMAVDHRGGERGLPVRWLVSQASLGLTVLAGSSELDRPITWAHSIELAEPGVWLRGGELMLTTGLRLPSSHDDRRAYVRAVSEAGVAALGFGTGLSHARVPRGVVAEAEAVGLPLLEVPLPTPFVAVTRAVSERLAELQYEGVVRASRVQPRMTRAALRHGLAGVLRELATALGGQVALVDRRGVVISASHPELAPAAGEALELLGVDPTSDRLSAAVDTGAWGVRTRHTVRVGGRVHGHLVVATPRRLDAADQLLAGHAVSLVALELERPLRLHDEQARISTVVLSMLVDGTMPPDRAGEYCSSAGLAVHDGARAMALTGPAPDVVVTAVDRQLIGRSLPRFSVTRGAGVLLLLPSGDDELPASLVAAVAAEARGVAVHAGTCSTATIAGFPRAATLAMTAARSAAARGVGLSDAADLGGFLLVADPAAGPVLAALAAATIGPLAEHDRRTGSDLVATLRAFLDNHGQLELAAAAAGVHRHTMRARMDRISELAAIDLSSAHVRAELLLAMTAWGA